MNKSDVNRLLPTAFSGSIIALLILTGISAAVFAFIGFIAFIPCFTVSTAMYAIAVRRDRKRIITRVFPLLVFIIVLIAFDSLFFAFCVIGLFFPAGISLSYSVYKTKNVNSSVSGLLLTQLIYIFFVCFIGLLEYGEGLDISSVVTPMTDAYKAAIDEAYSSLLDNAPTLLTGVLASRDKFVHGIFVETMHMLPYAVTVSILVASLLSYWLCKHVCISIENPKTDRYRFFGGFIYVRISRVGAICYLLVTVMATLATTALEVVFFQNLYLILSAVFAYAGASLLGYLLNMRGVGRILRYIIYTAVFVVCVLPLGISWLFAVAGAVDSFWHLRRLIRPTGEKYL